MDTNTIISISSSVIAFAALGAAIWQGYVARKHNKLSVIPRLHIDVYRHPLMPVKFDLKNKGIGPAIIDHFAIELDEKEYGLDGEETIDKILKKLGLEASAITWSAHFPSKGATLLPGDAITLIEFNESHSKKDLHSNLLQLVPRLGFAIKYRSIYGEFFDIDIDH